MAHKIHVKRIAHINKDGSIAKKKQDYLVRCVSRGKVCMQTRAMTQEEVDSLVETHRQNQFIAHAERHPKDTGHQEKHHYNPGYVYAEMQEATVKHKKTGLGKRWSRTWHKIGGRR